MRSTCWPASAKGARVNRPYAVLVSDSPQSLLDQMSGLRSPRQTAANLRGLTKAKREAIAIKTTADRKAADADRAITTVAKTRRQLQSKQNALQLQAIQVRTIYETMTGKQLAAPARSPVHLRSAPAAHRGRIHAGRGPGGAHPHR